jgi:flagellar basal body L-ring protein FlgH
MIKKILIISAVFSFSLLSAKSIWKDKNIYSSVENAKIGDIVIVNIRDLSNIRFNLETNSRSNSSVTSEPDMTITGFLPKISASKKITNSDSTQMSGKNSMSFSISARIQNKNGNLLTVAGTRTYSFSGVTNTILVNGLVDPYTIKGRSVDSNDMADFRLEIRGTKEGLNLKRDKLKEGDTAKANLTEQEKQDVIIDYLQKMVKELTK